MFWVRKRRVSTVAPTSAVNPAKTVLAQQEATCRSCGRRVTETGARANFRVVSRDAETGQFWMDACPRCRLRPG